MIIELSIISSAFVLFLAALMLTHEIEKRRLYELIHEQFRHLKSLENKLSTSDLHTVLALEQNDREGRRPSVPDDADIRLKEDEILARHDLVSADEFLGGGMS